MGACKLERWAVNLGHRSPSRVRGNDEWNEFD
jgi:hypothetical protein